MISGLEAFERLQDGDRRFASDVPGLGTPANQVLRSELLGEESFAVAVGQTREGQLRIGPGLDALSVIRAAGNIVGPSQIGSVGLASAGRAS